MQQSGGILRFVFSSVELFPRQYRDRGYQKSSSESFLVSCCGHRLEVVWRITAAKRKFISATKESSRLPTEFEHKGHRA
jgi:hypothetical protein